jgi:hypothetical protein
VIQTSKCSVIIFLLLTGAHPNYCVGQLDRVSQVLELEFAYGFETCDWNRVDSLLYEQDVSHRVKKDEMGDVSLTRDERLLARKSIIFLLKIIQTIPEYSSLKFECHRSVRVDQRTNILQWAVSRSDAAGGAPHIVELVFV